MRRSKSDLTRGLERRDAIRERSPYLDRAQVAGDTNGTLRVILAKSLNAERQIVPRSRNLQFAIRDSCEGKCADYILFHRQ